MHTFKKFISNRGSALFMVISTMTALMITCMAMYFTVVASRSTTYAIFNQKQSYQSAISVYNMLLNDAQSELSALRDTMLGMTVGDELTASGSDELLGDYVITIIKLPNETVSGIENEVFDIIVTTTVKGVSETVHSQTYYQPPTVIDEIVSNPNVSLSPTFAATGYVPNNVYLDKGTFFSDVYFDNEITNFGAYEGTELFVYGDVNCAGSVVFRDDFAWNNRASADRPITFAIRNMLTGLGGVTSDCKTGDKFLIGGDAYLSRAFKNSEMYINGDLHLSGSNQGTTKFYVNGDAYIDDGIDPNGLKLYCNGTVYYKGSVYNTSKSWEDIYSGDTLIKQGIVSTDSSVMTVNEMIVDLDRRTQTNPYYKWTINETDIPEVKLSADGNHHTLTTSYNSYEPIYIVHENAYESGKNPYGDDTALDAKWKKGCVIDDIVVNASGYFFVIIDTGDNADNVYTIRVQANTTGPDGEKYFTWTGGKGNVRPIVLVKGRGSVVIDVPPGVIYQDVKDGLLCHYNWWILSGREVRTDGYDGNCTAQHLEVSKLKELVHTTCGSNCTSGCNTTGNITVVESTEKCTRTIDNGSGGTKICGKTKKTVTCAKHGIEVTYCPDCELQLVQEKDGVWNFCKDHVDKTKVDEKVSTYGSKLNKDSSGKVIYPNCNIYLISSDESADFRFGKDPYGNLLSKNVMIGYVYAPYVTFAATGTDEGDFPKFMGGMTVSDYNFLSKGTFIMCMPDKNPAELMDDESLKHRYTASKDWKISLKTH